jgi:hypothetical protein
LRIRDIFSEREITNKLPTFVWSGERKGQQMVRKLFSGRMGLAVAAALSLAGLTSSSEAATITFDLRTTGGGKAAEVQNAGDAVTMNLYALVQNNDGVRTNDGFSLLHTSIISTEAATGPFGNLSAVSLNTAVLDAGVSSGGTVQSLDGNATDSEVGSNDTTQQPGYVVLSSGTATRFGSGSGAGPTEFLLGSVTWTYSGGGQANSTSLQNFFLRVKTDGNALSRQTVKFTTDGVVTNIPGDNSDGAGAINLGDPVSITVVPEPVSLGLVGLGALAALRRRRSM